MSSPVLKTEKKNGQKIIANYIGRYSNSQLIILLKKSLKIIIYLLQQY